MSKSKGAQKPNLLFIYTDEQAVSTMPCYGNSLISTPNMNRISDKSFIFNQAYCSQPVCTPSRSTILTGLYPHSTGCEFNNYHLPFGVKCFPELADFSGYKTGHFGKWHLGDETFAQHGFEKWISTEDVYIQYSRTGRDRNCHTSYYNWLTEQGVEIPVYVNIEYLREYISMELPEKHSSPFFLAQEATRFIKENRDNPFILYVNFQEPHMPFHSPRDNQYDPKDIPLPENFNAPVSRRTHLSRRASMEQNGHGGLPLKTEDNWKRLIANYWGLTSLVDTYVGKILDVLAENGLDENTIIVFTTDHGDMMGSHRLLAKSVQFQEAIQVPLLLHVPGLKPETVNHPVSQVDIVPTLLDLMGKEVPASLHGKSLKPYLENVHDFPREDVFVEWTIKRGHDIVRTVVSPDGWKYNCSMTGDSELYNLKADPGETRNLINDPGMKGMIETLYGKIRDFQKRTDDYIKL